MSRIYGNIGFKGLWNGLPVRIAMVSAPTKVDYISTNADRFHRLGPWYSLFTRVAYGIC